MTTSIDSSVLNQYLTSGDSPTLLDVRRRADADANPRCIAGAVYRDPEKIDAWIGDLPAGKPAVVYCVKGWWAWPDLVSRWFSRSAGELLQCLDALDVLRFAEHDQDITVFDNKAGRRYQNEIFRDEFLDGDDMHIALGA